jgi:hypothetical protein
MKIVRLASAIVVGTIVSTASNSAMAQAAGNPIPTPARAGFVCPKTIEGTTPGKGAEIRTLLPSGNALDNPAQLRASIDELKRFGLSNTLIIDHLIGAYAQDVSLSDAQKVLPFAASHPTSPGSSRPGRCRP